MRYGIIVKSSCAPFIESKNASLKTIPCGVSLHCAAQWPTDPTEVMQIMEMTWAAFDKDIKSGRMLECGWFANGSSGYVLSAGEDAKAEFAAGFANFQVLTEVHEVLDYETGKEIVRQVLKAQAEQMAAMKR
jgi:hypothetical protein